MKKLLWVDVKTMKNSELIDALIDNSYDKGIAKVYLEAKNMEDDEHNIDLIRAELERRLNYDEWICLRN